MKSLCFFLIFCYKINSEARFYAFSVCETVYENTKPATVRVALTCATKPRFSAWIVFSACYLWAIKQAGCVCTRSLINICGFSNKDEHPFWHSRGLEEKTREWGRKSFAFLQDTPKPSSGSLVNTMTTSWRAFQMNSTIVKLSSFQDT